MQAHPTLRLPRFLLRRHFLVDAPFQLRVIGRTVMLSSFLLATMIAGLLLPIVRGIDAPGTDQGLAADAATVFLHIHQNLWWIALLCLVLPALMALQDTHRVAGPMVRVKQGLRLLLAGRLPPPLRTRDKDYLKPEVTLLNEVVDGLDRQFERLRSLQRQLAVQIEAADPAHADAGLAAVRSCAAELGTLLQQFARGNPPAATKPAEPVAVGS